MSTEKGGILASTGKVGSGRVPKKWDLGEYKKYGIWASTRKVGSGRVPKMGNPGEYRKCKIRVSIGKGRIRASTGIQVSTENGESGRVLKKVGSGRVPEK